MSDIAELRRWLENEVDAGDEAVQVWADKARSIEEQLATIEQERDDFEASQARLLHIIECADTPLMRDVLAERDGLKEQLEAEQALRRSADAALEAVGGELEKAQANERHLMNLLDWRQKELDDAHERIELRADEDNIYRVYDAEVERRQRLQTALSDLIDWADEQQAATGTEMIRSLFLRLDRARPSLALASEGDHDSGHSAQVDQTVQVAPSEACCAGTKLEHASNPAKERP